jgi:hypothetical protein
MIHYIPRENSLSGEMPVDIARSDTRYIRWLARSQMIRTEPIATAAIESVPTNIAPRCIHRERYLSRSRYRLDSGMACSS